MDLNAILKNLMTKRGVVTTIGLFLAYVSYGFYSQRVLPMTSGDDPPGAAVTDVATTGATLLISIITIVAGQFLGVKPELIQAVLAFEKDKANKENIRRLSAAVIGYIVNLASKHPDGAGSYLLSFINIAIQELKESEPKIASALSRAAKDITEITYTVDEDA